jgi:hypothetical protein
LFRASSCGFGLAVLLREHDATADLDLTAG